MRLVLQQSVISVEQFNSDQVTGDKVVKSAHFGQT